MKTLALLTLFVAICLAQDAQKPACNAKTHGQYWPAEANSSPEAARRFTQSGDLEMCSRGIWKYKWEHLSINIHNLDKAKRPAAPQSKTSSADSSK